MYDNLDSKYSQLVMAVRKAETETPGSSVSEARAKSTVVGTDTALQVKVASSEPSYEMLTQQIAYLMSAVTNQTNQNLSKNNGCNGSKSSNGNGKYLSTKFQRPKRDRKDMKCWDVGVQDIVGQSVPHPGKGIISLLNPLIRIRPKIMGKI